MYSGMEQMMRESMKQMVQGKPLNAEQQRLLDSMPGRFVAVMREEMSWQRMKPLYVQLYQDTFEQDEVDGLLAFYTSPTGQAFLNKMPVVMQKSMALSHACDARMDLVTRSGKTIVLRPSVPLLEGEVIDSMYMSKKALCEFFEK